MHRRLLLVALVAVVLGGCVAPLSGGGGDPDPAAITGKVDRTASSIDTMQATVDLTTTTGNTSVDITARIRYDSDGRVNVTYVQPGLLAGTQIVSNGSHLRIYSPQTESVVVRNRSTNRSPRRQSGLFVGLDGARNATFEGNETLAGDDAVELSYALQGEEVSLLLAGGQPTSRLSGPADGDDVNVTVWVDRERWLPLKARLNYTAFTQRISYTIVYENVTVDEPLPAGSFEIETDEDTQRAASMLDAMTPGNGTSYSSYDELATAAGEGLPPETVRGASFQRAFALNDSGGGFYQLVYRGGGVRQLQYIDANTSVVSGDETITVDGLTVKRAEIRRSTVLEWHCGDRTYVLIGTGDRSALAAAVETIGCPAGG